MSAPHSDQMDRSRQAPPNPTNGRDTRPRPPGPEERRGATATNKGSNNETPKPPTLMDTLRSPRFWITMVIIGILYFFLIPQIFPTNNDRVTVSYTTFRDQVTKKNVRDITSQGETIQGNFKQAIPDPSPVPNSNNTQTYTKFTTQIPVFVDGRALEPVLAENGVQITAQPLDAGRSGFLTFLFTFGPTVLLIIGIIWLTRRATAGAGGAGGVFGLGRSRAKRYDANTVEARITFEDVAGIDEVENELVEIVDFLKNPAKYSRLGGTMPKGVLLIGSPGTGKTLLARATAGEANVPFFSMSGSEFIEMIVGVGASRVRDLFKDAKEAAPAIIFVDELDAIGRKRGGGSIVGGNDEREQTLNQLLVEMDGFDSRQAVIVIAATNRADVLDPALLRPGRFDRRVTVQAPDRAGRAEILKVHTRGVPLAADLDLNEIASETPGLVGADLRNLVNEAALLAARKGRDAVIGDDFAEALEKIALGAERKLTLAPQERRRVAYHESGHALLGLLQPEGDPVRRVTIIPRGQALGVTLSVPDDDRYNYSEGYLRARIVNALGGRAAEQIVYGEITTGAENDIKQVTDLARAMVTRFGMSREIGLIALTGNEEGNYLETGIGGAMSRPYSDTTAETIDLATKRIIDESYAKAIDLLTRERARLEALTEMLLQEESLNEDQMLAATGINKRQVGANPIAANR